jgi:hypothetical protein
LAIKKISARVQELPIIGNEQCKLLQKASQRLSRKVTIINPIIESFQIMIAHGYTGFESIMILVEEFESHLQEFSKDTGSTTKTLEQLEELIEELDDLIPLLQLSVTNCSPQHVWEDTIVYSKLIQASSCLSIGEHTLLESKEHWIELPSPFSVSLYCLKEFSNRKNGTNQTWAQEYMNAKATVVRFRESRRYQLKIESLDVGKESESITLEIQDIQSMYYTMTGTLLHLEDCIVPILVLKVVQSKTKTTDGIGTPKATSVTQCFALELQSEENVEKISSQLKQLDLSNNDESDGGDSNNEQEPEEETNTNTVKVDSSRLRVLEYIIYLCHVEYCENLPCAEISDRKLIEYFAMKHSTVEKQPIYPNTMHLTSKKKTTTLNQRLQLAAQESKE